MDQITARRDQAVQLELDLGVFQQFLRALLFPGPLVGQGAPVAGQVPQLGQVAQITAVRGARLEPMRLPAGLEQGAAACPLTDRFSIQLRRVGVRGFE